MAKMSDHMIENGFDYDEQFEDEGEALLRQQEAKHEFDKNVKWNGIEYYYSDPNVGEIDPRVSILINEIKKLDQYQVKQLVAFFALSNLTTMSRDQLIKKVMDE